MRVATTGHNMVEEGVRVPKLLPHVSNTLFLVDNPTKGPGLDRIMNEPLDGVNDALGIRQCARVVAQF